MRLCHGDDVVVNVFLNIYYFNCNCYYYSSPYGQLLLRFLVLERKLCGEMTIELHQCDR